MELGGNVGIGFIDFQGLWEGGKTAPSFSGLSTNRHFHAVAPAACQREWRGVWILLSAGISATKHY
jgi:hypothetical protein